MEEFLGGRRGHRVMRSRVVGAKKRKPDNYFGSTIIECQKGGIVSVKGWGKKD